MNAETRTNERSPATVGQAGAAAKLSTEQRKVLIPRLTVLRVSSAIWQLAVQRIAGSARLVVIDVSEPTENVLWEIAELHRDFGARCVLIGQHDRDKQPETKRSDGEIVSLEPENRPTHKKRDCSGECRTGEQA